MPGDIVFNLVVMTAGLLFIASLAATTAKRIRCPYTILLVIVGLFIGWEAQTVPAFAPLTAFKLTPEIVFFVFLPALLFEASFNLDAHKLLKNFIPIITLAVPGVIISAATIGIILHYALGLDIGTALLFGALISATDPVSVISLFKEMGAPKRLGLLVEGESLFNDGTSLVVFKIILAAVLLSNFSSATVTDGIVEFVVVCAGGALVGTGMGVFFATIIDKVENDRLVEITLTTILAHTTFLTADHIFGVSGVIATVAAGLTMGSYGRNKISPQVQEHMKSFWEYFAFISNSLIFLLVGLSVDLHLFAEHSGAILWGAFAIVAARALGVFTLFPLIDRLRMVEPVDGRIQTVIVWGGVRGALAIAMAISIPAEVEERELLLVLTLGVVIVTLIVNGLTLKPLMHALGLDRYSLVERFEESSAELAAAERVLGEMRSFAEREMISGRRLEAEVKRYEEKVEALRAKLEMIRTGERRFEERDEPRVVLRHTLLHEKRLYHTLFAEGSLGESNLREMHHTIDRELDNLAEGRPVATWRKKRSALGEAERTIFLYITTLFNFLAPVRKYRTVRVAASYERARARHITTTAVLKEIDRLERDGAYSAESLSNAREFYTEAKERARARVKDLQGLYPEYVEKVEAGILRRFCLTTELIVFKEGYAAGDLPEKVLARKEDDVQSALRRMSMRPVEELLISPVKLLGNVDFLKNLPEDEVRSLASGLSPLSFLPGEVVIREGERGSSLFIVGRGEVEVTATVKTGEVVISTLRTGEFFGEVALLHDRPRMATVKAVTPCTLLELTKDSITPLLDKLPSLRGDLNYTAIIRYLNTVFARNATFGPLDDSERDALASSVISVSVKAGEVVASEGEEATALYAIWTGSVEEDGGAVLYGEGDLFGEKETVRGGVYKTTYMAATETNLFRLDREKLEWLIKEDREMARKLRGGK